MDGIHDMGGMHGFGPVEPQADEPVFHHQWEARVFALSFCAGPVIRFNTDEFRFAIERIPGPEYLASSYYERWFAMLETLAIEKGTVSEEELANGHASGGRVGEPAVEAKRVRELMAERSSSRRPPETATARFEAGDRVRARNIHPWGHTRLPRYARGKVGEVVEDYGIFTLPDSNALRQGKNPEHCYAVMFAGRELWGPDGNDNDRVAVDLWESYLDPVGEADR